MSKSFIREMLTRYWFNATMAVTFVLTIIALTMCSHCSKAEGLSRDEAKNYATEAWQKAGFEWLYRLLKEPKRIGRMAKLPLFLVYAAGERIKKR